MEIKRFLEITNSFLMNANQIAFIEEAEKTSILLADFYDLFRYLMNEENTASLLKELEILEKYTAIQKIKYNNRFMIELEKNEEYDSIFIKKASIIDYLDHIFKNIIEEVENTVDYKLEIEPGKVYKLRLIQKVGKKSELFTKEIDLMS